MAKPQSTVAPAETREEQIEALMRQLRPQVEKIVRGVVEKWVDTPEHQELGAIENTLRDAGQQVAATVHQTGLASRKKRAT